MASIKKATSLNTSIGVHDHSHFPLISISSQHNFSHPEAADPLIMLSWLSLSFYLKRRKGVFLGWGKCGIHGWEKHQRMEIHRVYFTVNPYPHFLNRTWCSKNVYFQPSSPFRYYSGKRFTTWKLFG